MKLYIIAAGLFVAAFLILGILTASIMSGPDKPQGPQRAPASPEASAGPGGASQNMSRGGGGMSGPAAPSFTPAVPAPGSGRSAAGMPAGVAGASLPGALPAPGAPILPPRPPPVTSGPSVPVIQPTDLGTQTSPTAGKTHQ